MSIIDLGWRDWGRDDWNEALFLHFFHDSDGEDRTVHRIPVTPDELVKAVYDSGADTHEIQKTFLGVVRTSSHIDFDRRLSGYPIDPKTGWKSSTTPPFFVELAFSCLVASPSEGEIRNVGDFRNRLAMLLGHDVSVANYSLKRLPYLWRAFSRWLDWRRSIGEPYRRLELPPLDWRTLIGYSIKLSFPSRKDLITLTKVLSKGGIEVDPPIPAVFDLVGSAINKFSTGFRKAYDEFRDAFRSRESNLEIYPFWGAVREAVASTRGDAIDVNDDRRRLKLVIEPGGVVLLLSTVPGAVLRNEVTFVEADTPYGEFGSVLCKGPATSNGFYQATLMLLQGQLKNVLSGKGWQAINIALEQSFLLFKKTESLSWELAVTWNEEEDYQALGKNYLANAFLWALPQGRRHLGGQSQYRGWNEIEQFPGEWLGSLTYAEDSALAKIRCLQPTISGARLSLVGGCPVDGGYLGIPACLPLVRSPQSDDVRVVTIGDREGKEQIRLIRKERDSMDFSFPEDQRNPLEGAYRVIGSLDGRVLVQREIVFRPEIVVNDYARPTDPSSWEVEAGGPDVVTYGDDPNGAPRLSNRKSRAATTRSENAVTAYRAHSRLHLVKSTLRSWTLIKASTPTKGNGRSDLCKFREVQRFMEICGGLAMRRKGIPEAELLDLVENCLLVDQYALRWDVIRAWMEGGYFDRLHYKKWRRSEYFPCVPRFVLRPQEGQIHGVLIGLATAAFRNRADVELIELGAERLQVTSSPEWIVPAPVWRASSVNCFVRVSKILGLEEPTWTRSLVETLWSLTDIIGPREAPPKYYERWGCWNWDRGSFYRDTKPPLEGVGIIRFQRPDRPPYYQLTIEGEDIWWSTSRNWSLLLAYELRGEAAFAFAGTDQVVRVSKGQVYLPLPVGRYLSEVGVTTTGPTGDGVGSYVYQFRDSKERQHLLSAIWRGFEVNTIEMIRWARWILALSRRPILKPSVHAIPLPIPIRHRLEQFDDVAEFRELSRTKIDPSLLPHVRKGLNRFTKSLGV